MVADAYFEFASNQQLLINSAQSRENDSRRELKDQPTPRHSSSHTANAIRLGDKRADEIRWKNMAKEINGSAVV